MEESISGQKVVKVFRRNESVIAGFRASNEEVYRAGVYANTYALLLMPLTTVLGNLFVIVLAGLGGWLALQRPGERRGHRHLHPLRSELHQPLRQLSNLYNTLQAALAGAERVFATIDRKPPSRCARQPRRSAPVRGEVVFEACPFGYEPGSPVLEDMSLWPAQPARRSRWSGRPARARRPSSTSSPASTRSTRAIRIDGRTSER
jgi:ATP-binding cassette subfamily B multidrug efflux pump